MSSFDCATCHHLVVSCIESSCATCWHLVVPHHHLKNDLLIANSHVTYHVTILITMAKSSCATLRDPRKL